MNIYFVGVRSSKGRLNATKHLNNLRDLNDPWTIARILFLALLLPAFKGAQGQTGVRFGMEYEMLSASGNMNVLAGFDREPADQFAIGADLIYGFTFNSAIPAYLYGNETVISNRMLGLQYRSTYSFGGSAYIGTTLGIRRVSTNGTSTIQIADPDPFSYSYHQFTITESLNTMIFPLGLRLGVRSEFDGLYHDLYVGIGVNAGAGNARLRMAPTTDVVSRLWLVGGYAFGIGW